MCEICINNVFCVNMKILKVQIESIYQLLEIFHPLNYHVIYPGSIQRILYTFTNSYNVSINFSA